MEKYKGQYGALRLIGENSKKFLNDMLDELKYQGRNVYLKDEHEFQPSRVVMRIRERGTKNIFNWKISRFWEKGKVIFESEKPTGCKTNDKGVEEIINNTKDEYIKKYNEIVGKDGVYLFQHVEDYTVKPLLDEMITIIVRKKN